MSGPDVKSLGAEKLPRAPFPAAARHDFRVSLAPAVHEGVWKHASENTSVEICGVLVGLWHTDDDGPYAAVTQYIRCDGATQKFAEVTFTHDSWAQINKEMDSKYQDLRIIGWYHSHPNFGIFLSDRDDFIQQNFFSGAGQVAMVVDPVRKIEGIFVWRDGKTAPLAQFWVGDKLRQGAGFGTQDEAMTEQAAAAAVSPATGAAATTTTGAKFAPRELISGFLNLLIAVLLFLCGWMWGTQLNINQMRMIEQSAAQRFAVRKVYKAGFEDAMQALIGHQLRVREAVSQLQALPPTTDEAQLAKQKEAWGELRQALEIESLATQQLLFEHGLEEHEKEAIAQMIAADAGAKDHTPRPPRPIERTPLPQRLTPPSTPSPAPTRTAPPSPTATATPTPPTSAPAATSKP